jgi:succinyl-CoA:mesaconate CoA transferase
VANGERVHRAVADWDGSRPNDEIMAALGGRVPAGAVQNIEQIAADPHVLARQMIAKVEQPGSATPVGIAGSALKFTGTPTQIRRRAPRLDEDRAQVLEEWGSSR